MSGSGLTINPIAKPAQPLPIVVRNRILELIHTRVFTQGDRLPSEPRLAKKLNVGRTSLREALRLLEEEGYVRRRPGVGTFITVPRPVSVVSRLEQNLGALEIITAQRLTYEFSEVDSRIIKADQTFAQALQVPVNDPLVVLRRTIKVRNRKAILSTNVIPCTVFGDAPPGWPDEPLPEFLEERRGYSLSYGMATLLPVAADGGLARHLEIERGAQLLLIEQTDYTSERMPVLLSREYWVKGVVDCTVIRVRRKASDHAPATGVAHGVLEPGNSRVPNQQHKGDKYVPTTEVRPAGTGFGES
jgi:GntR family transcriptional regulator